MQFQTEAQKSVYEKIAPWMREIFGEFAKASDDAPIFYVFMGTTYVQVLVYPWGDDDAVINARSYVVTGAEITPDLMKYLLRKNNEMRFGAFGLDDDDSIFFDHSIVGSTCDKEELKASVLAVGTISDAHDEEIVSRWGGQRAIDRLK